MSLPRMPKEVRPTNHASRRHKNPPQHILRLPPLQITNQHHLRKKKLEIHQSLAKNQKGKLIWMPILLWISEAIL